MQKVFINNLLITVVNYLRLGLILGTETAPGRRAPLGVNEAVTKSGVESKMIAGSL